MIEPMLVLSTGNLTFDTCNRYLKQAHHAVFQKRDYGWFVYVIECRDGGVYLWAEGFLGTGRPEIVKPAGRDLFIVMTRRSMDAPAPGDWTLTVRRDASGKVAGLVLGSWLARGIGYRRQA